jgi:hypothetical protein
MLNYLSGYLSSKINFDIDDIIQVLDIEIIKNKFISLHIFLKEFIEYGSNKMIIYKNSLNILNMYILMGKPLYFIKIFDMFNKVILKPYIQVKEFDKKDDINNVKGYSSVQQLKTELKNKTFIYNDTAIPNSLILGFINELDLIIGKDYDYVLDYYNYCLIYDQQNILTKNKEKTSFEVQLNRLNKYYKMNFDELKINFIIDHLLLYLKYSNAYNIPSSNEAERIQYSRVIQTIMNYILYYQIENLPYMQNKSEIMENLYNFTPSSVIESGFITNFHYIFQGEDTSNMSVYNSDTKDSIVAFYNYLIKNKFITIKQDFMSYQSEIKMMCGEATILNLFNYFLYNPDTNNMDSNRLKPSVNILIKKFYTENTTFQMIEKNRNIFQKLLHNISYSSDNVNLYFTNTYEYMWEISPSYINICYILNYLLGNPSLDSKTINDITLKNLLNDIFIIPQQVLNTYVKKHSIIIGKIELKLHSGHSSFLYENINSEHKEIQFLFDRSDTYVYRYLNKYLKLWKLYGIITPLDKRRMNLNLSLNNIQILSNTKTYILDYSSINEASLQWYIDNISNQNTNFIYNYYIYKLYNTFNNTLNSTSFLYLLTYYNLTPIPNFNNYDDILNTFIMYIYTVKNFKIKDINLIKKLYTDLIKDYIFNSIIYVIKTYDIAGDHTHIYNRRILKEISNPGLLSKFFQIFINKYNSKIQEIKLPENISEKDREWVIISTRKENATPLYLFYESSNISRINFFKIYYNELKNDIIPELYTELLRFEYYNLIEFENKIINEIYTNLSFKPHARSTQFAIRGGQYYEKYIKYMNKLKI